MSIQENIRQTSRKSKPAQMVSHYTKRYEIGEQKCTQTRKRYK